MGRRVHSLARAPSTSIMLSLSLSGPVIDVKVILEESGWIVDLQPAGRFRVWGYSLNNRFRVSGLQFKIKI